MNLFDAIKSELKKDRKIVIIGHIQPDGDCIGSSLGLKHLLKDNFDIDAIVVNQDIKRLSFIGEWTLPGETDYEGAFAISVDNAVRNRSADPDFMKAETVMKIDHHLVVDSYGDINIERTLSSCCEIIASDAIDAGLIISKEAAKCLYTGMLTDTGRFQYPGVNGTTLRVAATLLDTGFDMASLISELNKRTMNSVNYISYAYSQLKSTEKGVLWIYINQDAIDRFSLSPDMATEALSVMRSIEGHPVYVLFTDLEERIRVEFRSDRININGVAVAFGGGGHPFASGARIDSKDMIPEVLAELDKLI